MARSTVLLIAHPREVAAWEPALRARGLEVSSAASRKQAGPAAAQVTPAAVVVSDSLPFAGALRAIRDVRRDPATRECPVLLVGVRPFTASQRLRLGASAPDATAPRGASPEAVAEAAEQVLRTGKLPPAELTPAQQQAMKYTRIANLVMMMGVVFSVMPSQGPQSFDRAWFSLLIPLGGLISDFTTGRVDGRRKPLSWQGWTALALMAVMALGILYWPHIFRLS